ncbi:BA14K family protein [Afifella pfennigii]|uniref:BA14K family protein n=1 Tax=Afifella pfennigii TaxID=209897 RepID=UPI00047E5817|nr:BA14K family protein [Afifella pfennigii]
MLKPSFLTGLALAVAVASSAAIMPTPAEAKDGRNAAFAAGIAAGAIGLGALAAASRPRVHYYQGNTYYYDRRSGYYYQRPVVYAPPPPPPVVYAPAPVYAARPAPWTPEWYAYCASKYRSFDPASGTFQPYRGPRQLCR